MKDLLRICLSIYVLLTFLNMHLGKNNHYACQSLQPANTYHHAPMSLPEAQFLESRTSHHLLIFLESCNKKIETWWCDETGI